MSLSSGDGWPRGDGRRGFVKVVRVFSAIVDNNNFGSPTSINTAASHKMRLSALAWWECVGGDQQHHDSELKNITSRDSKRWAGSCICDWTAARHDDGNNSTSFSFQFRRVYPTRTPLQIDTLSNNNAPRSICSHTQHCPTTGISSVVIDPLWSGNDHHSWRDDAQSTILRAFHGVRNVS